MVGEWRWKEPLMCFLLSVLFSHTIVTPIMCRSLEVEAVPSKREAEIKPDCECEIPSPPHHGGGGGSGSSRSPPTHHGGRGGYYPTPPTTSNPPSGSGGGYYHTPPTINPPSGGGGGYYHTPPTINPPSGGGGGGGYYHTPPTGGGSGSGSSRTPPSHGGGGYYPPLVPITPSPLVPTTPSILVPPAPPLIPDPNVPPFFTGTCNYWRTHPMAIWALFGYWGTVGGFFGAPATAPFGRNLSLQEALANPRNDAMGALYREGTASFLNSLVNRRFPFTTQQVREAFTSAANGGNSKAAAAQAELFKKANEGRLKKR